MAVALSEIRSRQITQISGLGRTGMFRFDCDIEEPDVSSGVVLVSPADSIDVGMKRFVMDLNMKTGRRHPKCQEIRGQMFSRCCKARTQPEGLQGLELGTET